MDTSAQRVALVTGGARRIGATIARSLHAAGCRVLLHYHRSSEDAQSLATELNAVRADSCATLTADFSDTSALQAMAAQAAAHWGRLDLLVNNASGFYPTAIGKVDDADWNALFDSNVKGAFFLSQALAPTLAQSEGAIVNIVDVHAELPLRHHAVYCMAKAALAMMTRSLALELGPAVRVNAVAPGAILWPHEDNPELAPHKAEEMLAQTALKRMGEPRDIAGAVCYLGLYAPYVTGQTLTVDGGRNLY